MNDSRILVRVARLVFPFVILYGIYIVVNGAYSPGGGFQGGAILATGILIFFFTDPDRKMNLHTIIMVEKNLFFLLAAVVSLYFFLRFDADLYLLIMNVIIGLKVALGLVAIVSLFLEEGR